MKDAPRCGQRARSKSSETDVGRQDTYDHLLGMTAKLMIEKDSVDFSLIEVAQKSGMSAALVQYHFGNKDGLLMALVENGASNAVKQLAALEQMELPAEKKLHMHVRGLAIAYAKAPYLNRLLHHLMNHGGEARAAHISDIFIAPVVAFHRKLIEQGVAEGAFRWVDPMHFYFMLVGACDHLVARRQAMRHAFGVAELSDELIRSYSDTLYAVISFGMSAKASPN